MQLKSLVTFTALLAVVAAVPKAEKSKSSSSTTCTTTSSTSSAKKTTSASATPTASVNNGQQFVNQCNITGVSIADCTQLGNIAALNGNSINASLNILGSGSSSPSSSTSSNNVNNGQQFLNQCNISGISVLDCTQLLNIALLNGNNISISVDALNNLASVLGVTPTLLTSLLGAGTKLPLGL